jgi:hypothetical protein
VLLGGLLGGLLGKLLGWLLGRMLSRLIHRLLGRMLSRLLCRLLGRLLHRLKLASFIDKEKVFFNFFHLIVQCLDRVDPRMEEHIFKIFPLL